MSFCCENSYSFLIKSHPVILINSYEFEKRYIVFFYLKLFFNIEACTKLLISNISWYHEFRRVSSATWDIWNLIYVQRLSRDFISVYSSVMNNSKIKIFVVRLKWIKFRATNWSNGRQWLKSIQKELSVKNNAI